MKKPNKNNDTSSFVTSDFDTSESNNEPEQPNKFSNEHVFNDNNAQSYKSPAFPQEEKKKPKKGW